MVRKTGRCSRRARCRSNGESTAWFRRGSNAHCFFGCESGRWQETGRRVSSRDDVPRIIPHSDGSGTIDIVGEGVSWEWVGRRVWCYGAQSYRPFGTAAEYTVVSLRQVVQLREGVSLEQGACVGIPGITAHRAIYVTGSVEGRTVLVRGGAGTVGACAFQLAHQAGARVIATCRVESDKEIASRAGANEVLMSTRRVSWPNCATNPKRQEQTCSSSDRPADLAKDQIKKVDAFVQHYNRSTRPFVWTATADPIVEKIARLCSRISGTSH